MKSSVLFLAISFLVFAVGCQENAVEPIVAKAPAKAAPVFQMLQINEQIEIKAPDGIVGYAETAGDITYRLTEVDPASLKKELPVVTKKVYSLTANGTGKMLISGILDATTLAKRYTWTFSGTANDIVAEGGEFLATFKIEGAPYPNAHLHLGFVLNGGQLQRDLAYIDFHGAREE
ncbi:MAG: hypothetical protein HW389_1678 [Bacteroidetes bacterium]|nr:hypothetical protein [Bacteroidota bacterium]